MVQGSGIDAPINNKGKKQAELFYQNYAHVNFDKIYTSNLQRTQQSVHQFIEKPIPHERLTGLNEISWGTQEGKPFTEEAGALYREIIFRWNSGELDIGVAGGESPITVMKRQQEAMNHIMSKTDEKQILICMHGRAMRILLSWLLNYELSNMDHFAHENLGLYELTFTGSLFRIDRFNDTSHLKNLTED